MFISNVNKREEVRELALKHLREQGIKYKQKNRKNQQVSSYKNKQFGVPLGQLKTEIVTLANGQQLVVPKIICDMTQFIVKTDPQQEGLFRLAGRLERINKIKVKLEQGQSIASDESVINVAVLVKRFFKELPESLIPATHHDLFLNCISRINNTEMVMLACLMLPAEHVNVLAYLMTFLQDISKRAQFNKMDAHNLAVCFGPNLIPVEEKSLHQSSINKTIELVELMIENANMLGIIPEYIINETGQLFADNPKKRRSGSLTRMFSGLRNKIVGKHDSDVQQMSRVVTPDLLLTPSINRSERGRSKKRREISAKCKKDVVDRMPQARLLSTPYTPSRTPVSVHPNPKKTLTTHHSLEDILTRNGGEKEQKKQWYHRSTRSIKHLKEDEDVKEFTEKRRNSLGPRAMLERRWSQVSQVANFRKKKRNSCINLSSHKQEKKKKLEEPQEEDVKEQPEPDYVRVSKEEYEEIKNRVTQIERRISMELDHVKCHDNTNNQVVQNIENVITAYEETLDNMEPMSPTTDHLAKRLSRELRIRKPSEGKVIRSPSARKIGTLRRRSREREKQVKKVQRHQSWHVPNATIIPRAHLIRPSTVPEVQNRPVTRSTSFQGKLLTPPTLQAQHQSSTNNSKAESSTSSNQWVSADCFFKTPKTQTSSTNSSAAGRASIAKIRSQNAGMVLAKAKLFDNMQDSDCSSNASGSSVRSTKSNTSGKIGSTRTAEQRMSLRVRNLRMEERNAKKSLSPRRRALQQRAINKQEKFLSPLRDANRILTPKVTPKNVPHIKKTLAVRSPKRLCRTPLSVDKRTPMKVLVKQKCEF